MGTTWQEVHIEAPVEKVFAFFADPNNFNQLEGRGGDYVDVVVTPQGVGTHYRMVSRMAGVEVDIDGRYTEVVPNRRIVDDTRGSLAGDVLGGSFTYRFEPEGTGTRVVFDHTHPGVVSRLPLLGHVIETQLAHSNQPVMDELKALLERWARDAP
jgi:uncharacterized protein YndB with AHSA1/START domain